MTIGDKIKHALHMDSSKKGDKSLGSAADGSTGPDAYQPMKHATDSAEGSRATQGGSGTTQEGVPSSKGTGNSASNTVAGSGGSGAYQSGTGGTTAGERGVAGSGNQASGSQGGSIETGSRVFPSGYQQDEPGYSQQYAHGKPVYKETVTEGDGKFSADLSASADNKNWALAQEKTAAAEREVATARLAGEKADREMTAAEQAELAVRKAQAKHREALLEAEKYRNQIDDPSLRESDLSDAKALYNSRLTAAQEAERAVREAEADLAGKKSDLDKLHPHVESYGRQLPDLESEYQNRLNARQAAEGDLGELAARAKDAEKTRTGYASELEGLESELQNAERLAAAKQQEYIDARNRAQAASARVAELRAKLREADDAVLGYRGRAQEAEENLPAYREAEQRALRDLENSKAEWYRLREMEDEYARGFNDANTRLEGLRGKHDPASRELRDAQSMVSARQDDLDRARTRAMSAEKKYKELLALADRHKHYGDSAAQAAHKHGANFEEVRREAELHGDKHVQLWNEAKTAGEEGSSAATSEIHKLQQKVKELMHKNEP